MQSARSTGWRPPRRRHTPRGSSPQPPHQPRHIRQRRRFVPTEAAYRRHRRAEITDLAAYLHHDTRTLVAECLRQAVILNQPDTSRSDQQLQRIDGRRAHLYQNLVRRRLRIGNLPNNQTAILRITIQLCSFHSSMRLILSFDPCDSLRSCMTASILSTAHTSNSSRIGRSVSLRAVSAYSTRGGTSA